MTQLTLSGQTENEAKEERYKKYEQDFFKEELSKLKEIRKVVIKGNGKFEIDGAEIEFKNGNPLCIEDKDLEWEKKKFLGEWWYCNSISGWNNNLPIKDNSVLENIEYDDVPDCDVMADSIRGCFISVDRDGVGWDRKYCLDRLNKAISCYEERIEDFDEKDEEDVKVIKKEIVKREKRQPKEESIMNLKFDLEQKQEELKKNPNDFFLNEQVKSLQVKIDKKREPFNSYLNKWKTFIENLIKKRGEEAEIWFDDSQPYDCEINVRIKGHRCYHNCVQFRFQEERLMAFDSNFGGGTSMLDTGYINKDKSEEEIEKWEKEKIIEIMEKVFKKECSNSSWEDNNTGTRKINIDEKGWEIDFTDEEFEGNEPPSLELSQIEIDTIKIREKTNQEKEQKMFKESNIPNGFREEGDKYIFYSKTTGIEEVRKDRIMSVLGDKNKNRIQTCDEFGCFSNCYGVTEEFCNHLIKELKLEKIIDGTKEQIEFNGIEMHTKWINPKIKQDETAKKIAEKKKELSIKRTEMMKIITEIKELETKKTQIIKLGVGMEVTIKTENKEKCKCGKEIVIGLTRNKKKISLELVEDKWKAHSCEVV